YIAWEEGETDKCFEYYEKSLELDPQNVTSMNGLGYVLACEDKDLTKALSYCKKAVASAPESAACLDSLGWVYYKLGIYTDAKKYLEMAEELDKDNELIAEHIKTLSLAGDAK
ncbi:MAG: tetratricopeptide repeat protein, partial [Treponema sp.]